VFLRIDRAAATKHDFTLQPRMDGQFQYGDCWCTAISSLAVVGSGLLWILRRLAVGVTDRLWRVEDLVALWEAYERRRAEGAA